MAAPMVKTRHAGIYRRGSRYVVRYRAGGRQRNESARTLDEALRIKRGREADRDRGEFQADSRVPFRVYATEWVERYQGRGRRGFRESTRDDYRRDLAAYAYPFFAERYPRTVSQITPRDVSRFVAWLCEQPGPSGRLSDASVRRILAPVRSCMETARQEGLIRHNPTRDAALPNRQAEAAEPGERVRVLSREQLAAFLAVVHPDHRPLFHLLATTGLRWSEATALRWSDLTLDGSAPEVRVRRALSRGRFGPPKSRHGRRAVPLPVALVSELRGRRGQAPPDALVFTTRAGTPLDHSNLLRRVLRPVAQEVGAPWAGFHTFRHTYASLHVARGASIVQLARLLGHHSAAFTLEVYAHLLPGDAAEPLDLDAELAGSVVVDRAATSPLC